jgi:PEP-CTERM motif
VRKWLCLLACVGAGVASLGLSALSAKAADPIGIDWYSVTPSFGDFNLAPCGTQDCGQVFDNSNPEVGTLLKNGLPVVSSGNPAGLLEGAGNPLNWWTPLAGEVAYEGTTIQSLPVMQNMFTPEGTGSNDSSAFQTAMFFATLNVGAGGGSITFGGDDDMFLALNGSVVDQLGGIHPYGTTSTYDVTPGTYSMEVFYADRHVVAAYADIQLGGDITTSVPEPATWALLLIGFAGLGYAAHNRGRNGRLGPAIP